MGRYNYGRADYDPNEVPTWHGVERSISDYMYQYNNPYAYGYPYGYPVPPELMRRQYVSDALVQEGAAFVNQQMEDAVRGMNEGIDATVEAANEGVQAVADGVNEAVNTTMDAAVEEANMAVNTGVTAGADLLNGGIDKVMTTRHEAPDEAQADRDDGVVFSTKHKVLPALDREKQQTGIVNGAIDEALQGDRDEPSMLEVMADASWRVGDGLSSWADNVQRRNSEAAYKMRMAENAKEQGVYSTRHDTMTAVSDAVEDGRVSTAGWRNIGSTAFGQGQPGYPTGQADTGGLASAFAENSRTEYPMGILAQVDARYEQLSREEMQLLQMERYQKSLELLKDIDFGPSRELDFSFGR